MASLSASSPVWIFTSTYSLSQVSGTFTGSELRQDPEGGLPEEPPAGHAVAELGHALEAKTEGEAGEHLGVVADELEHGRVDHPGAPHLDPARELADPAALATAEEA